MAKENFIDRLGRGKLVLDGATGSNLQRRGMPAGVCPEEWILENRDILKELQTEYIKAGSDVLYAPTFSGNRIKLAEYGLADNARDINMRLVDISKEAAREAGAGRDIYIAGDKCRRHCESPESRSPWKPPLHRKTRYYHFLSPIPAASLSVPYPYLLCPV